MSPHHNDSDLLSAEDDDNFMVATVLVVLMLFALGLFAAGVYVGKLFYEVC